MKRLTMAALAAMMMPIASHAQEDSTAVNDNKVGATLQVDFTSKYVWRGQDCGGFAVQPTLGIDWKGLSLTAWGSYELAGRNVDGNSTRMKELDLTLAYEIAGFNVGITDYYVQDCVDGDEVRYFYYKNNGTAHTFEANVGYDFFGYVSLQWYTNFAGSDGLTAKGNRAYTSYFEISAPFRLATLDWNATIGAVPYSVEGGYYTNSNGSGFAVTNVTLSARKEFVVAKKLKLPVFASLTANPSTQKFYFAAGFSLGI